MGNHFSCENTLLVQPCNGSKLKYLTITIILYTYYENSRHMLLSFTVSLSSVSPRSRSVFWSHKVRCNNNISFSDHILWRFGIEHICTSDRAQLARASWRDLMRGGGVYFGDEARSHRNNVVRNGSFSKACRHAPLPFGTLSVKSPREFAWLVCRSVNIYHPECHLVSRSQTPCESLATRDQVSPQIHNVIQYG